MNLSEALNLIGNGKGILELKEDGTLWIIPVPIKARYTEQVEPTLIDPPHDIIRQLIDSGLLTEAKPESTWFKKSGNERMENFSSRLPVGFNGGRLGYVAMGLPAGVYFQHSQ